MPRDKSNSAITSVVMPLDLMTAQEMADYLRISARQARRLMGKMPCYALGPRTLRVSKADLLEFIDRSRRCPAAVLEAPPPTRSIHHRNLRGGLKSAEPRKIGLIVLASINGERERSGLRPLTLAEAQAIEDRRSGGIPRAGQ
jgi:excisionase family DNA binding protein